MKIQKEIQRILCFGDSNTWGRSGRSTDRYPADKRWTGLLQKKLGEGYEILEEGLRSRTTDLDDPDPNFPGRNGKAYLRPCLESQTPIDGVVLWLGTNDLKEKYERSAQRVAEVLRELVVMIREVGKNSRGTAPWVLLVSPPLVREEVLKTGSQFVGAGEKSRQLAALIHALAKELGCDFLDIAQHVQAGEADGVHLELEMHERVAEEIATMISRKF